MSTAEHAPEVKEDIPPYRYTAALAQEIELRWQDWWDAPPHVLHAQPGRPAGRPRAGRRARREAVRARHVPLPVGYRPARRPPAGLHRHRRVRPLQAHDRAQRAAHDGLRRVRPARRAVRRRDRPAPARSRPSRTSTNYRRQLRRLGLAHDPRRSISTTDPEYYRWTQWIFSQIFNAWYDLDADTDGGGAGAHPIAELIAAVRVRLAPHPGRACVVAADADEQRRRHRRLPPGVRQRGAGQLVPGTGHGRRQRGGHRRRPHRPRQLPGLQAQHAPVDDADHRLRRPPDRRSRVARLVRRDQDHAAQLDRSQSLAPGSTSTAPAGDITVFTTRPDTLFGATFMVLAPEHPFVDALTTPEQPQAVADYRRQAAAKKDIDRQDESARRPACSPARTPSTRSTASRSRSGSPTTC